MSCAVAVAVAGTVLVAVRAAATVATCRMISVVAMHFEQSQSHLM